jgi:hypothetical protein
MALRVAKEQSQSPQRYIGGPVCELHSGSTD